MTEKEFVLKWANRLWANSLKKFPQDFFTPVKSNPIELPGKTLVIGEEFFGSYEILTVHGSPVFNASSHDEAKYIIYSNREKVNSVNIPDTKEEIKTANRLYENYLDSIIKEIESDYGAQFPGAGNSNSAVNEIFRSLNLVRY